MPRPVSTRKPQLNPLACHLDIQCLVDEARMPDRKFIEFVKGGAEKKSSDTILQKL